MVLYLVVIQYTLVQNIYQDQRSVYDLIGFRQVVQNQIFINTFINFNY